MQYIYISKISEPVYDILIRITYANNRGSGEPAHRRSLTRAPVVCTNEEATLMNVQSNF